MKDMLYVIEQDNISKQVHVNITKTYMHWAMIASIAVRHVLVQDVRCIPWIAEDKSSTELQRLPNMLVD